MSFSASQEQRACIVIQTHVDRFDPPGNLNEVERLYIVEAVIWQTRLYNPDAHIIVSGHGTTRPSSIFLDMVDKVFWSPIEKFMDGGQVVGMPAQYKYVDKALRYAKESGFSHALKTRGDAMIGLADIIPYCLNILNSERKRMLLTQQTIFDRFMVGDCFMFGEIDLMLKIWDGDAGVFDLDGLINTGKRFFRIFYKYEPFEASAFASCIWENCSFRDLYTLRFACIRHNFDYLARNGLNFFLSDVEQEKFRFENYLWGARQNWMRFSNDGNLVFSDKLNLVTESSFYGAAG